MAEGVGCSDCNRPVLYRRNLAAFNLFTRCLTQFRVGFAGPQGLDYGGVAQVMRLSGITSTPELFEQIQILEQAYLQATADAVKAANPTTS